MAKWNGIAGLFEPRVQVLNRHSHDCVWGHISVAFLDGAFWDRRPLEVSPFLKLVKPRWGHVLDTGAIPMAVKPHGFIWKYVDDTGKWDPWSKNKHWVSNGLPAFCSLSASLGYGFKDRLNICSQSSSDPKRGGGKDNKDGVWPVEEMTLCYGEGFAQCHPETEGERRPREKGTHTHITQWHHCSIVPKRMHVCRRTVL